MMKLLPRVAAAVAVLGLSDFAGVSVPRVSAQEPPKAGIAHRNPDKQGEFLMRVDESHKTFPALRDRVNELFEKLEDQRVGAVICVEDGHYGCSSARAKTLLAAAVEAYDNGNKVELYDLTIALKGFVDEPPTLYTMDREDVSTAGAAGAALVLAGVFFGFRRFGGGREQPEPEGDGAQGSDEAAR